MRGLQAARGTSLNDKPDPAGTGGSALTTKRRRASLLLVVALCGLLIDIGTKVWVVAELEGQRTIELGQLIIRVSRNPGAAFSFAEDQTWFFTVFATLVVAFVLYHARRVRDAGWAIALGLLLGGAAGNLVDRLFRDPGVGRGAVVDFLDFQFWPSFNVADSCIVVGGVLAVVMSFLGREIDGTRHSDRTGPAKDRDKGEDTITE